jgi:hypothetical protein
MVITAKSGGFSSSLTGQSQQTSGDLPKELTYDKIVKDGQALISLPGIF